MVQVLAVALAMGLAVSASAGPSRHDETKTVTWTGWFSDGRCARVRDGKVGPNNTECVLRCLNEGSKAVFISEQAKAIFEVKDYPDAREDVGYRIELTGAVDESAGTISVKSVKRLSKVVPVCLVPKRAK
jgi:hypothetical protein